MSNFNKLIEYFLKFPGIGPRQAKRFCFFLAGEKKDFTDELAELILEIKKDTVQCPSCFRLSTESSASNICKICTNLNRSNSMLMVVEKDVDLENIEKTGAYNGKYFVLGGTLPLANNGSANGVRLKELFNKAKEAKPSEIIIATSATMEGENTARYIEKILEPLQQAQGESVKITRLGRGLSTGTELEYIDSDTMSNALDNRK